MTRIDMTTREWHELLKPVIPHAGNDPDMPQLAVIRIETADRAVYAIATDRYTLGAERHDTLHGGILPPIHIRVTEAAASLRLFTYSKDADPPLRIVIDKVPIRISVAGRPGTIDRLGVTLESDDGTRLVLHDHRDPSSDPLAGWRKRLLDAITRAIPDAAPALTLNATQLGRWGAAVRKGERLAIFTGTEANRPLLVIVESHFCGVWQPVSYLEGPEKMLAESPWLGELPEVPWLSQSPEGTP